MPVITLDWNELLGLIGEKRIEPQKIIEIISSLCGEVKKINNQIEIELLASRSDLYSAEGIARAVKSYLNDSGMRSYQTKMSDIKLSVDASVKNIRPFIFCGLVRNVQLDESGIISLMDMQERLHITIGRNRRKVAIGVHDYDRVCQPFTYKAVVPESIRFVPLGESAEMDLEEVLQKHEKGIAYRDVLRGFAKYPVIVDSKNNVLSFPPIINGALTGVTPHTKNIFVDVTGTDRTAVSQVATIVVTALAERGGEIYTCEVVDKNKKMLFPELKVKRKKLTVKYVNALLGLELTAEEITSALKKMGFDAESKNGTVEVLIPPYRFDIFHSADLAEDVAIGCGYEKFKFTYPEKLTFGEKRNTEVLTEELAEVMVGLGFNEVVTLTLSSPAEQFEKMHLKEGISTPVQNPISERHTILRVSLIPSLLDILRLNKRHELPQKIFELGDVVIDNKNVRKLGAVFIHSKASFTELKSVVEVILKERNIKYTIQESASPSFIEGRRAVILKNGIEIGYFGEFHPEVITNFELSYPAVGFEITVSSL